MLFVSHCQVKAVSKCEDIAIAILTLAMLLVRQTLLKLLQYLNTTFCWFLTPTPTPPTLFCNSTLYTYQLSSVASSLANATCFGHWLRMYEHLKLLFLTRETLLLPPRQRQKAGCVFISGGYFPPPTGLHVILSRRSNQRTA